MTLPFEASIDIRDAGRYKDVMKEYGLGPMKKSSPLSKVKMAPFGPSPYSFITYFDRTVSRITMLAPYGNIITRSVEVNDIDMFPNKYFLFLDGF